MLEYPLSPHSLANTLTELGPPPPPQGHVPAGSKAGPPHGTREECVCIQLPAVGRTCLKNEVQSFPSLQLPHETADTLKKRWGSFPASVHLLEAPALPFPAVSTLITIITQVPWHGSPGCPSSDLHFPPLGTFRMTGISSAAACGRTKLLPAGTAPGEEDRPPGSSAGSLALAQAHLQHGGFHPFLRPSPH